MRKRALLKLGIPALAAFAFISSWARADTIVQTEGTPAPSLSPVLNYDVNFDSIATGTLITATMFAGQGIASITNAGDPLYTFLGTQSPPNYVGTGPDDGWAADITITFGALQNEVGFGDAGPNTTTLSAYGATGALLFTNTFSSATNDYWVLTDNSGANIASIEISSSFIAIDDVQFQNLSTTTPEPGTLLLIGPGLLMLGGFLRRKLAR